MMDRYPDDDELKRIADWSYEDIDGMMKFIKPLWKYSDIGYWHEGYFKDKFFNKIYHVFNISTGGWSGNEDIVYAMKANTMFWAIAWWSSRRGGHYSFRLLKDSPAE